MFYFLPSLPQFIPYQMKLKITPFVLMDNLPFYKPFLSSFTKLGDYIRYKIIFEENLVRILKIPLLIWKPIFYSRWILSLSYCIALMRSALSIIFVTLNKTWNAIKFITNFNLQKNWTYFLNLENRGNNWPQRETILW